MTVEYGTCNPNDRGAFSLISSTECIVDEDGPHDAKGFMCIVYPDPAGLNQRFSYELDAVSPRDVKLVRKGAKFLDVKAERLYANGHRERIEYLVFERSE